MNGLRLRSRRKAKQILNKALPPVSGKKVKVWLRLPVPLLKKMKKSALWEGLSVGDYIVKTVVLGILANYPPPEGGWPAQYERYASQGTPATPNRSCLR